MSKIDKLASAIAEARFAESSEHANLPNIFRNPDIEDHTSRLRSRADEALMNASSIFGAGSTQREHTVYDPDTFSEFGVPLSSAKQEGIEEWTRNLDGDVEGSGSSSGNSNSNPTKMERDLSLRIVRDLFDKAEQSWASANYPEAEKFFRAGLDQAKKLASSKRQDLHLNDIRLNLAFTRLQQKDFPEAIYLFKSLLSNITGYKSLLYSHLDQSAIKTCRNFAYFGLAQAYLGKCSFDDAETWCQKCNECWNTTTSNKADSFYPHSLQLMACIYRAKGNSILADTFFEIAVREGYESSKKTPYMLDSDSEAFQEFRLLRSTFRVYLPSE